MFISLFTPGPQPRFFEWWGGGEGVRAYLKNRDRTINVGMIGRVSSEDRRVMGGPGAWPRKKI